MENIKQILDELDDGYKYFAIKKDGCWYKIEFDSFMVKDIERAQNICSELNQMLKNACGDKEVETGDNNALLPDVSNNAMAACVEPEQNCPEYMKYRNDCKGCEHWK